MKVGDLITTYYSGYFRLTKIEKRFTTEYDIRARLNNGRELGEEYSPLYYFVQEFDNNGNNKKSKEKCCDARFCNLASKSINEELLKIKVKQYKLIEILENEI